MAKKGIQKKATKKAPAEKTFFPRSLLVPVGQFLQSQIGLLEKRKRVIAEEDPFADSERIVDNASPDTDAAEQFGHAKTSAIKEQLERKIIQTRKALASVRIGIYGVCGDCGKMIDTDRLMVYPEATLCASCQKKREK